MYVRVYVYNLFRTKQKTVFITHCQNTRVVKTKIACLRYTDKLPDTIRYKAKVRYLF